MFDSVHVAQLSPQRQTPEPEATTKASSPLAAAWASADDGDREQFIRAHLAEVWRLVDVVTAA
jgi:hypothetical protein